MKLLDCTLRDGGYYTKWNFSQKLVESYLKTVSRLPISIVELGYFSDENDLNGPFYHLNENILLMAKKFLRKDQKIFVMINAKEIKNSKHLIKLILGKNKLINGIRFAIPPIEVKKFLKILKPAQNRFPKISFNVNLMYLSKWYSDIDFSQKIISTLSGKVDVVSIVDSYGAMLPYQITNFLKVINNKKIKLGCHFHNNCGLALANTLSAIDSGCVIADSTFKGMGRGAGNAETELMLALKAKKINKISSFDINTLIEKFEKMKEEMKWGSSYAYAYAAKEGYSQNQMMDLMQKRRLDAGVAIKAIESVNKQIKKINFNNLKSLKKLKITKNIKPILIGGAPSLKEYGKLLFGKIHSKVPIILSGSNALFNFSSLKFKIDNPLILILSGSEIKKINMTSNNNLLNKLGLHAIIVEKDFLPKNLNFKKKNNIVTVDSVAINPLLLTGLTLLRLRIRKLHLAFFDGDSSSEKGRIVMEETEDSLKILIKKGLNISTITKSFLPVKNINPWIYD